MNVSTSPGRVDITILVKALNEEQHIEACLRSALEALESMPELTGEILLADSVSTDRTVEIAAELGVRIVQFENVADRSCGAALQLGYQYAFGRYIYVLDGDMTLVPAFLRRAYSYLQQNPDVAGVGGRLIDTHIRTEADRRRTEYYSTLQVEQVVTSLGGGGLYRRDAIDRVGYLSHRWLPAFEEAELAVRLQAAGYRLIRVSDPAIHHSGHAETSLQMLQRLWRSRRIDASGMFLRSAFGRPWFAATAKACWFVFAAFVVYGIAGALMLAMWLAGVPWPALVAAPFVVWAGVIALLAWRKRSVSSAFLSVLSWHAYAVGGLRGFCRSIPDPAQRIPARQLSADIGLRAE
jgi:GT2 family glycosyltransferase